MRRAISLTVSGTAPAEVAGRVLAGDKMDAHNTFDEPNVVQPKPIADVRQSGNTIEVLLPPASVSVLEIR